MSTVYTEYDAIRTRMCTQYRVQFMTTVTTSVSVRELRSELADVVARASYGRERVQITKNGKPAAYIVGPEDFDLLESLEKVLNYADSQAAASTDTD